MSRMIKQMAIQTEANQRGWDSANPRTPNPNAQKFFLTERVTDSYGELSAIGYFKIQLICETEESYFA